MTKITGYILLVAGLLLIILPLWQTYLIFTGAGQPPEVFKTQKIEEQKPANNFNMQAEVQNAVNNILPVELINNIFNLSGWVMLMFILMHGGKLLAGIGIQLIKIHANSNE